MSYIADQLQAIGLYINFAQNIPINEYDDKVKIKFTGPTGKQTNNIDINNRDLAAIYRMLGGTGEKPPLSKLFKGNKLRTSYQAIRTASQYRQDPRGLRGNQMRSSFDKPVFGPGRAEYKRIDTTTGAGMRLEQKMRRAGWYQAQVTPFSTVLYRKKRR